MKFLKVLSHSFYDTISYIFFSFLISRLYFTSATYLQKNSMFFKSYYIFLNWKIIVLQCYVRFCCITVWISYVCTYIPSWASLHVPYITLVGHHTAPSWTPCVVQQLPTSYLLCTWWCVYPYTHTHTNICQCYCLDSSCFSFPCCVHKAFLCVCISITF